MSPRWLACVVLIALPAWADGAAWIPAGSTQGNLGNGNFVWSWFVRGRDVAICEAEQDHAPVCARGTLPSAGDWVPAGTSQGPLGDTGYSLAWFVKGSDIVLCRAAVRGGRPTCDKGVLR